MSIKKTEETIRDAASKLEVEEAEYQVLNTTFAEERVTRQADVDSAKVGGGCRGTYEDEHRYVEEALCGPLEGPHEELGAVVQTVREKLDDVSWRRDSCTDMWKKPCVVLRHTNLGLLSIRWVSERIRCCCCPYGG